ncbi:MAG: elongation factor P [Anaerolineales bacterium]|nr:elongation factor P [Anaerolineales bacterium]
MATTSDLRRGMLIRYNGGLYRVVEYEHIAPGNWRAMVRMKLKNFENGKVIEDRVRAGDPIDVVQTETRTATYLYNDGTSCHFMDTETFDQIELPQEFIEEQTRWIKENDVVTLLTDDHGKVLDVEVSTFVALKVTQADAAVRGDTAGNVLKNATLETGSVVKVPAFIKEGDTIKIDTRSGEYVERA